MWTWEHLNIWASKHVKMWACEHVRTWKHCWYRILSDLYSYIKTKTRKKKFETVQKYEFQTQKGKNKYNMFEWKIKKSQHLKNPFYRKSGHNPNRVWSKSWLFNLTIGSCWILDRHIGNIFSFKTIVYKPKSKLKQMRYHKNTETLIKSSLYFSRKLTVFYLALRNKLYQLGKNWNKWVRPSWRTRS